jgi:hypothetical protein
MPRRKESNLHKGDAVAPTRLGENTTYEINGGGATPRLQPLGRMERYQGVPATL